MRKRSRSRSNEDKPEEPAKPAFSRRKKREGGGFSDKAPEQPQAAKLTTAEILDYYKQYNPTQNLTNHNKAERQLYVGNIPQDIGTDELVEILNKSLQELGKEPGIF